MSFSEDLAEHFQKFSSAPFLFVGAGVSRRYLNLDDWSGLLARVAALTDKPYEYYLTKASGDFAQMATEIAYELFDTWWADDRFSDNREKYKDLLATRQSPLKAEVCAYVDASMDNLPTDGDLADELALFRKLVIDGVITTNYDPLLEHLFPEFKVFVGQEELLAGKSYAIGEIYEIHGSSAAPDSLVLTSSDYDDFDERNAYLAAKLMTVFVEHPVVFLGYSMGDRNVQAILREIVSCLKTQERIEELADRLVFVEWNPDAKAATMSQTVLPISENQIPVLRVEVPDFLELFSVLGGIQRSFPAKLLRQLKEHVYELVATDDPQGRLYVQNLEPGMDPRDVDVVFGVGAIASVTAYTGLHREELIDDVLADGDSSSKFDPLRVVKEALPEILTRAGNVPIFKYLSEAKLLDDNGQLQNPDSVDAKILNHIESRDERISVFKQDRARIAKKLKKTPTLAELLEAKPSNPLFEILGLDPDKIDLEELRTWLVDNRLVQEDTYFSQWVKLVCFYDWLQYGQPTTAGSKSESPGASPKPATKKPAAKATSAGGKSAKKK